MKTTTATKTAVTWMLIGGVAALAASMALGLPWKNWDNTEKNAALNTNSCERASSDQYCQFNGARIGSSCGSAERDSIRGTCQQRGDILGSCYCQFSGSGPMSKKWKITCIGGSSPDRKGKELFYDGNEEQLRNIIENKGDIPENNFFILREMVAYGSDCNVNRGSVKYSVVK